MTEEDWYNQQVDPNRLASAEMYVYRYRPVCRFLEEIKSRRLYMSTFSKLNDPKESGLLHLNLWTRRRDTKLPMLDEISRSATEFAKAHAKALCVTLDHGSAVGAGNLEATWGRGFAHPRMWAQYADNHRGACLIFDRAALHRAIKPSVPADSHFWHGCVHYKNPSRIPVAALGQPEMLDYDRVNDAGFERAIFEHISVHRELFFFQKALDWRDELEYRWIIWDNKHSGHCVDFGDALKGVVVGSDYDVTNYNELRNVCAKHRILVRRMNWHNGAPRFDFLPHLGFDVDPEVLRDPKNLNP
jgi:Protein of unknown function (DUF2971)